MYDIKTHDLEYILSNKELYEKQLNIYSYIWQEIRKNRLDNTAIISTAIPKALRRAIKTGNDCLIQQILQAWNPLVEMPVKEKNVQDTIEHFGEVVDNIEDNKFSPASVKRLSEKIEYTINKNIEEYDVEEIFPSKKKFPQKELLEGTPASLYDVIQWDSDVEKNFVENRLKKDGNILLYFKFPGTFKINIPRIIGNYNPDWGIVRFDDSGTAKLELVRETKGTINEYQLQFPNESRKIKCAKKHFKQIKIDYRQVTDQIVKWWESEG
jgi:restriction endonuclease